MTYLTPAILKSVWAMALLLTILVMAVLIMQIILSGLSDQSKIGIIAVCSVGAIWQLILTRILLEVASATFEMRDATKDL